MRIFTATDNASTALLQKVALIAIMLTMIAVFGGCGGSSSDSPPDTASLTVTVSGLPTGTNADVQISGPAGFSTSINQTQTLTGLTPGSYSITGDQVSANAEIYRAGSAISVTLASGANANAVVAYGRPIETEGVISQFGSLFVNGVRYNDSLARVTIEDSEASSAQLDLGMIVTIEGRLEDDDNGTADHVDYSAKIEGPVDAVDLAGESFTVFGQVILVNEFTQWRDTDLDSLQVGNLVEVSAYFDDSGNLVATRVKFKAETAIPGEHEFKLKGIIQQHDEDLLTFELGSVVVGYDGAEIENQPDGGITDGLFVKVKSYQGVIDGVLLADKLRFREDDDDDDEGENRAVDGVIVEVIDDDEFIVNDWHVVITDDTRFQHGSIEDIVVGQRVKVHGSLNDAGQLVARKIHIDKPGAFFIEGEVEAIDLEAETFQLLGLTIQTDEHTHFFEDDDDDEENSQFGLADLMAGDFVEVLLMEESGSEVPLVAKKVVRLERDDDDDDLLEVEGRVTAIEPPNFNLGELLVLTDDFTEFEDENDMDLSAEAFFERLQLEDLVEVTGNINDMGAFVAKEVEFENDDDEGNHVELAGKIDSFESAESFTVNGYQITTTGDTDYENGSADDLAVGVLIELEGYINDMGIIVATEIEFDDD